MEMQQQSISSYTAPPFKSTLAFASTTDLQAAADYIQDGWIILWQHHAIFTIQMRNARFDWPDGLEKDMQNHLLSFRAFNSDREWHVWRQGKGFAGRKRQDSPTEIPEEASDAVEVNMPLRALIASQLPTCEPGRTWLLCTRNYIGYNEFHHAQYEDQRFVTFTQNAKEAQP